MIQSSVPSSELGVPVLLKLTFKEEILFSMILVLYILLRLIFELIFYG